MMKHITLFLLATLLAWSLNAGVPMTMNYQGYLTSSAGAPINGTKDLVFRIYSAPSGGSSLWTESQSGVGITNGIFSVVLGSVNSLGLMSASYWRAALYLEVQVQTETLSPRHQLVSSPNAISASRVVYGNVVTVAQSGGDCTNVYAALQIIAALSPVPSSEVPYLIELKAGVFNEPNSLSIPDYVSVKGAGNTTTINLGASSEISIGSGCTLSDLRIQTSGANARISASNAADTHIKNCSFDMTSANPYALSFLSSEDCTFIGNKVVHHTSGNYTIYMQAAVNLVLQDNYIDITSVATGTAIYAANTANCVIKDNIIVFEGNTDSSRGIYINNNYNSTRVTGNVFKGELTTPQGRDIYSIANLGYPVRPTHAGPYGINNHGSSGSALPDF